MREEAAYILRSEGWWGLIKRGAAAAMAPLIRFDSALLVNRHYDHSGAPPEIETGPGSVRGEVLASIVELETARPHFHPQLDFEMFRRYLGVRSGRFVALARYEAQDGSFAYIGGRCGERARFSIWGTLDGPLPENYILVHDIYTVPEFRGQEITRRSRAALHRYYGAIGVDRTTAFISKHNRSSRRAYFKSMPGMTSWAGGTLRRVTLFRRFVVWQTPFRSVVAMVTGAPAAPASASGLDT